MVVLIAVAASEVTAAHWDQVREHRMAAREKSASNKARLAELKFQKSALFDHVVNSARS